jgi:uncharacterized protein
VALFGQDFNRAKAHWLYPREPLQGLLRGALFFILLAVLDLILQSAGALAAFLFVYKHSLADFSGLSVASPQDLMKSAILGLSPAAIVLSLCAIYFSRFGMPNRQGRLLLNYPKLGILGWIVVVGGFVILMFGVFNLTFVVLGIDPETYSPSGGLSDNSNSAGMVEKTIAEFAKSPMMFALALPSVMLAGPITEELLFRGAFFSALANSPVGRIGAVLITSALWALVHRLSPAPWLFVGVLFIMGIVLGVLLLRFGSLWVTIACHVVWNAVSSIAIFGVGSQP